MIASAIKQERESLVQAEKTTQPRGLYWLFMTELWERFGFYTIQTIAVLYLTKGLDFSDGQAFLTIAGLNSLLYLTPVAGGMMADKVIGYQRAIMIGGGLFAMGYLIMAFPQAWLFFLGASMVIVANGYFKPNVSSIVGELYDAKDARRDGGYTIFYMGINIGALLPSLFIGWLVFNFGWHSGFLIATVGMLLSLTTFHLGKKHYKHCGAIPKSSPFRHKKTSTLVLLFLVTIVIILAAFTLFKSPLLLNVVVIIGAIGFLLYTLFITMTLDKSARNKMIACIILTVFSIAFWMLYNQTFGSLMLFADRNMDQSFLGIPISAENTQFFNPFFIIVLSPILSTLWIKLSQNNLNPSFAYKFSYAIWLVTLGFAVLWLGVTFFNHNGITASGWLVFSYFLQTSGELLISPVGLAMITVLAPKNHIGMMMGMWFLSQTAAFSLSGLISFLTIIPEGATLIESSHIYANGFGYFALISLIVAIFSLLCAPHIKRLITSNQLESN